MATKKNVRLTHEGVPIITNNRYYDIQGVFEKAQEIAMYYGFTPTHLPMIESEDFILKQAGKQPEKITNLIYNVKQYGNGDKLSLLHTAPPAFIRTYIDEGMHKLPQPVMMYSFGPRYENAKEGNHEKFTFDLEILGSDKSIMDALAIRMCMLTLEELGGKYLIVHINSLGDKTCRQNYSKELANFYRKHINDLDKDDRQILKSDPLQVLQSEAESTREINANAPDPLSFLSTDCKKQFKEVLEYLDELGIAYQIDKSITHEIESDSHTLFEIRGYVESEEENGEEQQFVLASGGRHDNLAKMLGSKKDLPAVGASIFIQQVMQMPWFKPHSPRNLKTPKAYFIQLGTEAKMKSLTVLENLRKAKIPVVKSLSKDGLQGQLAVAEKIGVPNTIIFGHKEALEGTVIIRNMKSRSQKTVTIDKMVDELKKSK